MAAREISFEESVSISSPSSQVYAFLSEPKQFLGLQPFLTGCEIVSQKLDAQAGKAEYEVIFIERFKLLGPLGYDNRIRALMKTDTKQQHTTVEVRSFPNIRLHSDYRLSEQAGKTQVTEIVRISSPEIMASFVGKMAQAAHRKLLANLKARCEGA